MDEIELVNIKFKGANALFINQNKYSQVVDFSKKLMIGKAYLLKEDIRGAGWTLGLILGGEIMEERGEIIRSGRPFRIEDRKREVWCVRYSQVRTSKIMFRDPSVKEQVQFGLKRKVGDKDEEKRIIEWFNLSPERYDRPIKHLSTEAWRASCAIGYANDRKIFCFPSMEAEKVRTHHGQWLDYLVPRLKETGAMVLLPVYGDFVKPDYYDEVIKIY